MPARRSTIELVQRLKPQHRDWDEFLRSAFEDWMSPEPVKGLERRERDETSRVVAEVGRAHPKLRR